MDLRFQQADTIVFLDLPTLVCLWGAIKRYLQYRQESRPDMTEGNRERLTWEYLGFIWNYRRTKRPGILEKLEGLKGEKGVMVLSSRRAVREFVQRVATGRESGKET